MAFQGDETNSRARRLYFGLDELPQGRVHVALHLALYPSDTSGISLVLPRTTLARRSARASSATMAKANSPSLIERTILGCLKAGCPHPWLRCLYRSGH